MVTGSFIVLHVVFRVSLQRVRYEGGDKEKVYSLILFFTSIIKSFQRDPSRILFQKNIRAR